MVWRIEKLVREKIKPVPDVRVTPIPVFGSPIVVVDVLAGEEAPYSTFENDVFVRRGATNRKPDPLTELPSVVERARERRERRLRQEHWDALDASSFQKGDDG
jgi:predicted HTH transcriptional regulator